MKKPFLVSERVCVYGKVSWACSGMITTNDDVNERFCGAINTIINNGTLRIRLDNNQGVIEANPHQCRRLRPKKKKRSITAVVNEEVLNGADLSRGWNLWSESGYGVRVRVTEL